MWQHTLKMGQKVKDRITGFTGIITGMCSHITGCDTIGVNPGIDKDGKLQEVNWFDWTRLEILDVSNVMESSMAISAAAPGGPQDHPRTI